MVPFLRTFFAVIFAILFLASIPLVLGIVVLVLAGDAGPPHHSWLQIRLSGPLLEHHGPVSLQDLLDEYPPSLMEITENLEKAAVDDRIEGVLLELGWFGAGLGKLDEIRAGIRTVRDAGKPVYAWAFDLRDGGVYLGSECDSLVLAPPGRVYFLGRGAVIEHVKGTLDELDVRPHFHRIDEYKSASELWTAERSSKETLENLRWVFEDLAGAYDDTLAANLGLARAELSDLRERGVLTADGALEAGVVHATLHRDELDDLLRGSRKELRTISSADYSEVTRESLGLGGSNRVAVVHAQGFVASGGDDRYGPVVGLTMGPDRVVENLETARNDDRIDAILLRWDTGGGATDGAQRIARAVARARQDKPVVVSIADQAASGGYMMSYPANRVVCPANGITGSIGSIVGKFNVRGFWEKLGLTFDDLPFAPNAFLLSSLHDYTPEQEDIVAETNWAMYRDWIEDIAQERGLLYDDVDRAARGRVWTGRQARERHLVDGLGGFHEGLAALREVAGFEADEKVTLVHLPEKKTLVQVILSGDFATASAHDLVRDLRSTLLSTLRQAPGSLHLAPFGQE